MPDTLPSPVNSLLGREQETALLCQLLRSREVRLVTITGPGGVGKTSLAIQAAHDVQDAFTDGVFFISLAAITDATLIIPTIAHTLTVIEAPNRLLLDSLKDFLRNKRALLLLDNFEQIISAAPLLSELLSACAGLRMLTTSREALRLRGEHEFPLAPLALPGRSSAESLLHYAGIALFVQRAQAIQPDFQLAQGNAPAVAEICARLDGLPLAIELAAARIKLLPPQAMLERLRESSLRLLTSGAHDLPLRQQTLRQAIQWSYDLLNAGEQRAFRSLSVFVGGCTMQAALTALETPASLDTLDSLVNKNLLRQAETDGLPRLTMFETIREFGWAELARTHELEAARRAHAGYYLSFAEEAEPQLAGADQKHWLQRLERELDNLRAALHWALEQGEVEFAQRLADALQPFWFRRGRWSEGRRWLEDSLAMQSNAALNQSIRANALYGAGMLARFQGDYARGQMLCEQSLEIYRSLADQTGVLKNLAQLCRITSLLPDQAATKAFMTQADSLIETLPDSVVKGEAYTDMALALLGTTTLKFQPEVTRYLSESERIHRAFNNQSGLALASLHRAVRASFEGDYTLAVSRFEEAERLGMELGDFRLLSRLSGGWALLELQEGDFAAARRRLETCIQLYGNMGDHTTHTNLLMLAAVLHRQRLDSWAARIWGMADALAGSRLVSLALKAYQERFHLGDILAELRAQMGDEAFAREVALGRRLTVDDLRTIPHPPAAAASAAPGAALTARETEVLHLLAQELSNPHIAEQLVVSRRTVDAHLRSIYDKLGVKSRDAAIRVARQQGLI